MCVFPKTRLSLPFTDFPRKPFPFEPTWTPLVIEVPNPGKRWSFSLSKLFRFWGDSPPVRSRSRPNFATNYVPLLTPLLSCSFHSTFSGATVLPLVLIPPFPFLPPTTSDLMTRISSPDSSFLPFPKPSRSWLSLFSAQQGYPHPFLKLKSSGPPLLAL